MAHKVYGELMKYSQELKAERKHVSVNTLERKHLSMNYRKLNVSFFVLRKQRPLSFKAAVIKLYSINTFMLLHITLT